MTPFERIQKRIDDFALKIRNGESVLRQKNSPPGEFTAAMNEIANARRSLENTIREALRVRA